MTNTVEIRELSADEINAVSGGFIALGVAAIVLAGVALGYKVTNETLDGGTVVKDAAKVIISKIPPR